MTLIIEDGTAHAFNSLPVIGVGSISRSISNRINILDIRAGLVSLMRNGFLAVILSFTRIPAPNILVHHSSKESAVHLL